MQKMFTTLKDKITNALIVDREKHIYRCHRSIFTDPQLFDFEMKHVFEGNWLFLAHESQIAQPGDYYTLTLGRQPVIITRDKKNELHALINSCAHRGAMLCRRKTGNKSSFTCRFKDTAEVSIVSRLPFRQPECRCTAAGGVPGRNLQNYRPDR